VVSQESDLEHGFASAAVRMKRAGIVVLSASFDRGWTARIDGRPAKVFPVAPALVATRVPAGVHTATFRYVGFSSYLALFLLSGVSTVSLAVVDWKRRRGQRGGRHVEGRLRAVANETVGSDDGSVALGVGPVAHLKGWSEEDEAVHATLAYHPGESISGLEESRGEKDEAVIT
jgi:hypothetical protein